MIAFQGLDGVISVAASLIAQASSGDGGSSTGSLDWWAALGAIGTAFAWLYQWRVSRYRSKLKDDLEILAKLKEEPAKNKEHIESLESSLKWMLSRAYPKRGQGQTTFVPWTDLAVGFVFTGGAVACFIPSFEGVWLWLRWIIAASLAFVGIGAFLNAHEARQKG
jgi:hypothetical protein